MLLHFQPPVASRVPWCFPSIICLHAHGCLLVALLRWPGAGYVHGHRLTEEWARTYTQVRVRMPLQFGATGLSSPRSARLAEESALTPRTIPNELMDSKIPVRLRVEWVDAKISIVADSDSKQFDTIDIETGCTVVGQLGRIDAVCDTMDVSVTCGLFCTSRSRAQRDALLSPFEVSLKLAKGQGEDPSRWTMLNSCEMSVSSILFALKPHILLFLEDCLNHHIKLVDETLQFAMETYPRHFTALHDLLKGPATYRNPSLNTLVLAPPRGKASTSSY